MKAAEVKLSYKRKASGVKVKSSADVAKVLHEYWDKDTIDYFEIFVVVYLSRHNEVLGIMKVSEGSLDACMVDPRKIFQGALLSNSSSIILAHNHPSGGLTPSQPDLKVTKEISHISDFLKIKLLDHIILTSESYLSMADEGGYLTKMTTITITNKKTSYIIN